MNHLGCNNKCKQFYKAMLAGAKVKTRNQCSYYIENSKVKYINSWGRVGFDSFWLEVGEGYKTQQRAMDLCLHEPNCQIIYPEVTFPVDSFKLTLNILEQV